MVVGERVDQRAVEDAEDGGVGADADGQGAGGEQREPRCAEEEPHAMSQVLQQRVLNPLPTWRRGCRAWLGPMTSSSEPVRIACWAVPSSMSTWVNTF